MPKTNETNETQETSRRDDCFEDEINLIDYILVMWKWKIFIILMVGMCAGLTMGVIMLKYPPKYITQSIILLNFPGIEKHQNPDKSLFEKSQIITPAILTKAGTFLQKKDKTLNTENIRRLIGVKVVIPPEIQEEIEKTEKTGKSYTYFPNRFSLTLTTRGKKIFSEEQRGQVLLGIIKEYRKEFERKYGEEPLAVVNIPENYLEKYDYIDIVNIFQLKTSNIIKSLDSKIKKAGFFRSPETRLSFVDIKDEVEILKSVELERVAASIYILKLTKNKKNLINQYRYEIEEIEIREKKKEKESAVAQKLLKEAGSPGRYAFSKGEDSKKGGGEAQAWLSTLP